MYQKEKKIDINRPDKIQERFNITTTTVITTMIMNFSVLIIHIEITK